MLICVSTSFLSSTERAWLIACTRERKRAASTPRRSQRSKNTLRSRSWVSFSVMLNILAYCLVVSCSGVDSCLISDAASHFPIGHRSVAIRNLAHVLHPHFLQRPVPLRALAFHWSQARQVASRAARISGGVVEKPERAKRCAACPKRVSILYLSNNGELITGFLKTIRRSKTGRHNGWECNFSRLIAPITTKFDSPRCRKTNCSGKCAVLEKILWRRQECVR